MTTEKVQSRAAMLRAFAELSKALAWPIMVFIVFLLLYSPIKKCLETIPNTLNKATRVSVQGIAFETIDSTGRTMDPQVKQALKNLDAISVGLLIRMSGTGEVFFGDEVWNEVYKAQTHELRERGLVGTEPGNSDGRPGVRVRLTTIGQAAAKQMYEFVSESLKELGPQ